MKVKTLFAALLVASVIFGMIPTSVLASETEAVNAQIMDVYGGADGIVSMTFDDGYYSSSLLLDELFEKYDLKGSLMLIADKVKNSASGHVTPSVCDELFENGHLEPQSHSMTHIYLNEFGEPENQTPEVYEYEIVESKAVLEEMFPEYDVVAFAIPYGGLSDEAMEYAKKTYYAVRTTKTGVQSLDPGFTDTEGSWSRMYSPVVYHESFQREKDPEAAQWEWIKSCIDNAANGWYIPIIHRVGDIERSELSYNMADKMFAYIASLRDEGKVWVATYSEAVKYVRERQNSTVQAYVRDGDIYVGITMAEMTEDNLPLTPEIFDTPLTVKVEVPSEYNEVYYTVAEKEYSAETFSEGDKNYAYVNIIPNQSAVKLRSTSAHYFTQWDKYDEEQHKRTCIDCGLAEYGEHVWNDGEIIKEPTHTKTGSKKCVCVLCMDDETMVVKKTDKHTFSEKNELLQYKVSDANCMSGDIYYYSCKCGETGTKTFEVGQPTDHVFDNWEILKEATETDSGLRVRVCECGELEYKIIPAINTDENEIKDDTGSVGMPVFVGVTIGATIASLAIGFVVSMIIFKKKGN